MPSPHKRFCPRGHDTDIVGRFPSSRRCRLCQQMHNRGELGPLGPRLPFQPLGDEIRRRGLTLSSFGEPASRSFHRYQHRGLTLNSADEWACRLGMHPVEIWGMEFYTFDDRPDREVEA